MHHYCTSTCNTIAVRKDILYVWPVIFPEEGYIHCFIFNGLLTCAALHKPMVPVRGQTYLALSAQYWTQGRDVFKSLHSSVNDENWRAVFCFSGIVAQYACASPRLRAPVLRLLDVLSLIRGSKVMMGEHTAKI